MIVKVYKGVIDLDLSLVSPIYRNAAIQQHYKDIEEYKKYQLSLNPEHRYENTIERINKNTTQAAINRSKKQLAEQNRRYELCKKIADNIANN